MTRPPDHQPAFEGFASPSFTQVPDELFDCLMPTLSDCELRVLLYIVRRTFGFKRDADKISLSQMVSGIVTRDGKILDHGTGLSKATVARGLAGLREKGVIVALRNTSAERGHEATTYRLRFQGESSEAESASAPLSQPRDKGHSTPLVSAVRRALSHQRDTQHTVRQHTDFESSKGGLVVDTSEAGVRDLVPTLVQTDHTRSTDQAKPLAALVTRRARLRPPAGGADPAIVATIERFAEELGDRAARTSTIGRTMNLFRASGMSRDGFIDLLFRARGEVRDRWQYPGKAPRPANLMAYLFAVVEDWLGVRPVTGTASAH